MGQPPVSLALLGDDVRGERALARRARAGAAVRRFGRRAPFRPSCAAGARRPRRRAHAFAAILSASLLFVI